LLEELNTQKRCGSYWNRQNHMMRLCLLDSQFRKKACSKAMKLNIEVKE